MRSGGAQRRNFIGNAAVIPKDRFRGPGCDPYARSMPNCMGTSRIPTSSGPHIGRGENPCSISPCSSDLRWCARTSPTSASVTAGKAARCGAVGPPATPMPFLYPARASAVDFLCPSGPLSPSHEIANSYSVALGRYRPSGAFRCWRLPDARRGIDRDRHAADDPPRSGLRRRRDLAIVRDRLNGPAPTFPERKQPCSMSS
jgi:hypothetical protein